MTACHFPVAIIGGGPCGLFTALLLSRFGVRCAVFERRDDLSAHPKAMGVRSRTAEIFHQAGVLDAMRMADLPPSEYDLQFWGSSLVGEEYGRVPLEEMNPSVSPYGAFHCPQTITERTLLDALEKEPNAGIFFGHEVQSVEQDGASVKLHVHRPGCDQHIDAECQFAVAADGAGSPVRHWLGIGSEGPGDQGHFLNTYFRANYGRHLADRRAVLYQALTTELFETIVSVNGSDLWLMHHFLQEGETPADYPPERLEEIVKVASGIPDEPVEILSVSPWVMSPKIAASFRKGNIFLTGDASARLSPAGGLGMNTGLQSAHNLAWKLAAAVHGAPDALLDSYESERQPLAQAVFHSSDAFRSEVWKIVTAGLAGDFSKVREIVAHSKRGESALQADLGWHYGRGAFVAEDPAAKPLHARPHGAAASGFRPDARPGGRAPHVWLERAGVRISTLDLFGRGFVLVTSTPADAWQQAKGELDKDRFGFSTEEVQIGGEDGFHDPDGRFREVYGLAPGGAVLVRPDGVVAWRSIDAPADPARALSDAFAGVFSA